MGMSFGDIRASIREITCIERLGDTVLHNPSGYHKQSHLTNVENRRSLCKGSNNAPGTK